MLGIPFIWLAQYLSVEFFYIVPKESLVFFSSWNNELINPQNDILQYKLVSPDM